MAGQMKYENVGFEVAKQFSQLLPLDFLGGSGDPLQSLIPDFINPVTDVAFNKDYFGKPVYKETPFNKLDPEFTKIYKGTSKLFTVPSEWMNELGGGDKYLASEGVFNWNPAKAEHIVKSYFGGLGNFFIKTYSTDNGLIDAAQGKESDQLIWRNAPILSRFIYNPTERGDSFGVTERFYNWVNSFENTDKVVRGYMEEISSGNNEYEKKLDDLMNTNKFRRYMLYKSDYQNIFKTLYQVTKSDEAPKEEVKEATDFRNKLMKEFVDRIEGNKELN